MHEEMKKVEGLELGKVVNLADALEVVSGAVVSRTLLKRPTGNITLFTFGVGQGLSEHTAPFDAWLQVLDGEARVRIGGEDHQVRSGEVVIMPADVPHALEAVAPLKMLLVMIRS